MSENGEKYSRATNNVFRCVVLAEQQSKAQRYLVYHHRRLQKSTNHHIIKLESVHFGHFCFKNYFLRLIDYKNLCW